jgi:protein involved in polysaccharide export with SLBB domain
VNFNEYLFFITCISKKHIALSLFLIFLLLSIYLFGCSDQVTLPTTEQLAEFENAGPLRPTVDFDLLIKAKIGGGPYKVMHGDVLELTIPAILQAVTDEVSGTPDQVKPSPFRVSESGTINLPIVGEITVTGKTLSQIESAVIDAYYPAYAATRPSVFVRVAEFKTIMVSISGAVQKPGVYSLRSDQKSLVALIMEAGGIINDGASAIRISHHDQVVPINKEAIPKPPDLNKTKQVKFFSRYPGSNEVKIQLYFQQEAPLSTIGILTIRQDEKRLLTDQIDLADKRERLLLLDKLAQTEPIVSIVDIDQKLDQLKESLTSEFGKYKDGYKVSDSNIDLSNLLTANSALQENLAPAEYRVTNTSLVQKLSSQAKRKLREHLQSTSDSQQGKTVNDNISSNLEFSTNRSVQESTLLDDALGRNAPKITARSRKPGTKRISNRGALQEPETLVLPVKGFNIPFVDVALQDGDSVIVERLAQPLFSVIGLVNKPGNFPYPPDVRYNLMQALAFAGGFVQAADPRYATIYRLKPDGTIVSAIYKLVNVGNGSQLTYALNVHIKPGDIVAVEHTPRTRTAMFLDRIFRINIGTYLRMEDAWD